MLMSWTWCAFPMDSQWSSADRLSLSDASSAPKLSAQMRDAISHTSTSIRKVVDTHTQVSTHSSFKRSSSSSSSSFSHVRGHAFLVVCRCLYLSCSPTASATLCPKSDILGKLKHDSVAHLFILMFFRLKGGEAGVWEGPAPQQASAARRRAGAPSQGVFITALTR